MAVHNILSPSDLCDAVRALSDESLYDMTGVSKPAYWPGMRVAMMSFAYDCGTYLPGEEREFFADFMRITDMEATQVKTVMGVTDVRRYSDLFTSLKANDHIPNKSRLINTTQIFSLHDHYVSAWFTCVNEQAEPFWVYITDNWEHSVHTDLSEVCDKARHDSGSSWFAFSTYGNIGHWPLVHSGIRDYGKEQ